MQPGGLGRRLWFWLIEHLGPALLCLWFATIRMRWCGGEYAVPSPSRRKNAAIFVFWHQRLLCFVYTHRGLGGRVLVSRSRDGEIIARLLAGLGFAPVRGSTRRGGAEAMRELLAVVGDGRDVGMTPDGPRGPQRVFKAGAVYLASRSGLPIVPLSVAYRGFWTLPSWDGFQLPRPFTRALVRVGGPIHVPPDLDAAGMEAWRRDLEAALSRLTADTDERREELYRSGQRRPDECW